MDNELKIKKISCGIDFVKSIAVFFVVCVHFFLQAKFYRQPIKGSAMILFSFVRYIFFTCVPLFLITTGYLQRKKTVTKKFYMGIVNILVSYAFIAVLSVLMKIFFFHKKGDLLYWIFSVTDFSANNYAWYVSMFIGLYLLIPFLNSAYNGLKSKNDKRVLILVLFLISCVANFNFHHTYAKETHGMFSEYWVVLYPFTYYFIGAYINEYKPKIKKSILLFGMLLGLFFETGYVCLRYYNRYFPANVFGEYNAVPTVFVSICFFLIIYDIDFKNIFVRKILRSVSVKTLDIYLFSFIVDSIIYAFASQKFRGFIAYEMYAPLFILTTFLCSYILAFIKEKIFMLFKWAFSNSEKETRNVVSSDC